MKISVDILSDTDLIRVEIRGTTMFFGASELENVINVLEFWYIANDEADDNLLKLINELTDLEGA